MGIRIQPREIVISDDPDGDPFENDLLDRKEKAEVLTSLVSNIDGPCTMAVDAAWGAGKTTFLKMWAQYLRNEGFPVVEFNAWETDASGDPFVALTTEITQGLKEWPDSKVVDRLHQTEFLARQVFRRVAPGAIRLAAGFIPVVGSEVGNALGSYVGEAMAGHAQEQQSAAQYKSSLQELANSLRASSSNKPTIVLIDELDRCRPTYAIELLETAKHIFGVDGVVFVLAVNRAELAHSVKALYGSEFDAVGYLRRFFDIDFLLPAPDRQQFICDLLASLGVAEFLSNSIDQSAKNNVDWVTETFVLFLSHSDLSLRSIGQAIHRFGVVLSSLADKNRLHARTLTVLTILSAIKPSLYRQFIGRENTVEKSIEELFLQREYMELRRTSPGALVEAVMLSSRLKSNIFHWSAEEMEKEAPLLGWYKSILEGNHLNEPVDSQMVYWARIIYEMAMTFSGYHPHGNEPLGFDETVQRLELLSPDLKSSAPQLNSV